MPQMALRYCAISTISNAAAGDYYELIGRFAATLSAGAGYTWSVPTFTGANLIQHPIYQTRWLTHNPTFAAGGSMTYTSVTATDARYKVDYDTVHLNTYGTGTIGGTPSDAVTHTLPFATTAQSQTISAGAWIYDGGGFLGLANLGATTYVSIRKYNFANWGTGANKQSSTELTYPIN
jgi:hypothetical protein